MLVFILSQSRQAIACQALHLTDLALVTDLQAVRLQMKVGQKVLIRFIGSNNNFVHPMHIHGGPFTIVATDGTPVPQAAQITKDTVNVGPGERYDVIWTAREVGKWLIHCHIPHHTTNDNVEEQGAGGLTMVINVTP